MKNIKESIEEHYRIVRKALSEVKNGSVIINDEIYCHALFLPGTRLLEGDRYLIELDDKSVEVRPFSNFITTKKS